MMSRRRCVDGLATGRNDDDRDTTKVVADSVGDAWVQEPKSAMMLAVCRGKKRRLQEGARVELHRRAEKL